MDLKQLFNKFETVRVAVVGDVMIDAYIRGKVNRISPEAPVPVVSLNKKEERLGGAANVALNLVSLGAKPIICSCVGNDEEGKTLVNLLKQSGIRDDGLIFSKTRMTTVKTRVIGNSQHLLRIDSEQTSPINKEEETHLIKKIEELILKGIDILIFEDYNKGVLTPTVIKEVINLCNKHNVLTAVDPKKDNFYSYKNVTLFKPNLKELIEGTNTLFSYSKEPKILKTAIKKLEENLNNQISFVTLSEHGVYIKDKKNEFHFPAHIRDIADVSGAGDTVISVAALCLASGANIDEIANIANIAGGLVCEESGVVSIDKKRLFSEIERLKSV